MKKTKQWMLATILTISGSGTGPFRARSHGGSNRDK